MSRIGKERRGGQIGFLLVCIVHDDCIVRRIYDLLKFDG